MAAPATGTTRRAATENYGRFVRSSAATTIPVRSGHVGDPAAGSAGRRHVTPRCCPAPSAAHRWSRVDATPPAAAAVLASPSPARSSKRTAMDLGGVGGGSRRHFTRRDPGYPRPPTGGAGPVRAGSVNRRCSGSLRTTMKAWASRPGASTAKPSPALRAMTPEAIITVHERHLSQRSNWLRAAVLGANDGTLSTSSLVLGVAGAGGSGSAIVTAGIAGLVAGALSMAAGEYVSVSSQRDTEEADTMCRPPTPLGASLLGADRVRRILFRGGALTVLTLVPAYLLWSAGHDAWQSSCSLPSRAPRVPEDAGTAPEHSRLSDCSARRTCASDFAPTALRPARRNTKAPSSARLVLSRHLAMASVASPIRPSVAFDEALECEERRRVGRARREGWFKIERVLACAWSDCVALKPGSAVVRRCGDRGRQAPVCPRSRVVRGIGRRTGRG